ncbi:hypothetical protein AB6A40_007580 [Gnathostoma spinigerum]|uniref:Phospholipid-transporting ATPase n=1 Tax=Gnathostoma spinigerum TaxID=75299 RepID=A0ABD6EM60_9BILA
MALCHTVVPEEDEASNINYQASSPDEAALVRGAADLGVIFHTRKPECVTIDMLGTEETYQVLHVLEFTSSRKRMGVVLRTPDSSIILYVKGADSVIFERLSQPSQFLADTTKHLVEYAEKGYRTLCFATRSIEESFYMQWSQTFHEASVALHSREEKLAACAEQIEKELTLIGATAIEDKLQEHVPETIAALLNADIRIWMLTGDKRETAINIAHASALISSDTTLLILNTPTYDETYSKLLKYNRIAESLTTANARFALIIDARSLHHALMAECQPIMADLTMRCHAVVCCRMSPIQKAEVVDMVRSFGSYTVLAIGDGANDVAMIQAADVGIGISGEEGLQASSASDYSISQFQYLRRLLLVHGAWDFDRSVKVILYSFYKNICLYLIELWFALFSAFSGQTIFERWTIGLFNVIFTACPPIVLGLFDRPVSENLMLTYPSLYFSFQERAFSKPRFGLWIGTAILHSILLFFFSYGFLLHCVVWRNGRAGGWLMLGNSCYSFVIVTVCIKALVECSSWTSIMVIFSVGSIISWFIFLGVYSIIWPLTPLGASMSGMAEIMLSSGVFWLALLIIPFCTLMWDVLYKIIQVNRWPTPRDIATYTEKLENTRAMDTSASSDIELREGRSLQGVTNEGMVNSYGSIDEETMEVNQNVKQTGEVSSGSTASTESRMESGLVHSAEITNRRSSYLYVYD